MSIIEIVTHRKGFSAYDGTKTDRRILRTRALLRQGLAELMQEKNAGDITVKELVAHANVNRSTFYLHYTDIDQMLASVEAELLERIEASVQAHPHRTRTRRRSSRWWGICLP